MKWLIPVPFLIPLGIISESVFKISWEYLLLTVLVLILFALFSLYRNFLKTALLLLWIIVFITEIILIKFRTEKITTYPPPEELSSRTTLIRVDSFPKFKTQYTTFNGRILKLFSEEKVTKQNIKIRINLEGKPDITYGQCLIVKLNCKEAEDYGVPGVPSYKKILGLEEIKYICNARTQEIITKINNCDYFSVQTVNKITNLIRKYIKNNYSEDIAGFLLAITIGDRSELDENIVENFRNSGTAHLLAISGLHVGIVVFFVFFLIKTILKLNYKLLIIFNLKRLSAILTIPFIFIFCLIAGMSPSTQRALIMSVIVLSTIALMRKPKIIYITSLTWCLILILDPSSLFDISFQLSFSAVFAIILFYSKLKDKIFVKTRKIIINKIINIISGNLLTTIAGFAGTAIIIARTFKTLPLFFIPANLIAIPLSTLILPATIIYLFLFWLPENLNPFIQVISFLTKILFSSINLLGGLKFSSINVTPPDNIQFVIYYLILIVFLAQIRFRARFIPLSILITIFISRNLNFNPEKNLRITFIDVGQGDATFIELPDGNNMLVDCGKKFMDFNAGERIIAPFLWFQKIKKINILVMTHHQADHTGGCKYIIERFAPEEIWLQDTEWNLEGFDTGNAIVRKFKDHTIKDNNGVKIISMNSGISNKPDDNNNSLVLKIEYKNFSLLLTGDIGEKIENLLSGKRLKSTVLKVPHHGSCTSSSHEFLRSVNPVMAIISAGRQNMFHHPCKKTVERLREFTNRIFVTANDGSITITSDGEHFCYTTYLNGERYCNK